ncbi:MAG: hypothetical protein PHQ12_10240, partial [Chthoniobacteraceae bacterium]|nr:hypothetical protein [Chthoniobacteraceae bacterium]
NQRIKTFVPSCEMSQAWAKSWIVEFHTRRGHTPEPWGVAVIGVESRFHQPFQRACFFHEGTKARRHEEKAGE